jgi:hypothetical protein
MIRQTIVNTIGFVRTIIAISGRAINGRTIFAISITSISIIVIIDHFIVN